MSVLKTFWGYFKNLSLLKNLSILKENFGSADGLGISLAEVHTSINRNTLDSKLEENLYFTHDPCPRQLQCLSAVLCAQKEWRSTVLMNEWIIAYSFCIYIIIWAVCLSFRLSVRV